MISKEVLNIICSLEKKYPVDRWCVNGFRIWPIIRCSLSFYLQSININQKNLSKKEASTNLLKRSIFRLKVYCKAFIYEIMDYKHSENKHKADLFCFSDNNDRIIIMPDGTKYDRVLDPIKDEMIKRGYNSFSKELLNLSELPNIPRYSFSSFFYMRYLIVSLIVVINLKVLQKEKLLKKTAHLEQFNNFILECKTFGFNLSIHSILKSTEHIRLHCKNFERILKQCNTRLVLTRCWYSSERMALCAAAKKNGINIIDIQHGVAGGGQNQFYCSWTKIPLDGYELMPNVFWCNTEADCNAIQSWNNASHHTKTILGRRSLQYLWMSSKGSELIDSYLSDFLKKTHFSVNRKKILVSLQPLSKNTERMPEWLIDFIKNHNEYYWLIRRHPMIDSTQRDFINKIKDFSNVNIEESFNFPLDIVFRITDVHLTMFSSVAMEAAEHGVPTVFLVNSRDYSSVISKDFIFYGRTPNELIFSLNEAQKKSETNNYFFEAFNEIERLIKKCH